MEYYGGLEKSEPAVRNPFEKGRTAMEAYRWDEAIGHFGEAMKHAAGAELAALNGLVGRCHDTTGRLKEALESHEQSARLAEQSGDRAGLASALDNIGGVRLHMGEFDKALEYSERALKQAREAGARNQEASALMSLGASRYLNGDSAESLKCYEDALTICRETGDRKGQALALLNAGLAREQQGEKDKALESVEQSLKLSREIGAKGVEAAVLGNLAFMYQDKSAPDKSAPDKTLSYSEAALKLFREVGATRGIASMLAGIGSILIGKGEHERAVASYLEAQDTYSVPGTIEGPERYRHGLGRCLAALGRDRFVAACLKAGKPKAFAEELADQLPAAAKE